MTEAHDSRTDHVLLQAIAQQDVTALGELYRRYAGRSLTLAHRHDLPDPEQVIEEAFVAIFHSAAGFSRSALPADVWTLGMIQRHCSTLASSTPQTSPEHLG